MSTIIKSQAFPVTATFFDFLTTIVCKEFFYFWFVFAGLAGTLAGGGTNFTLGRFWVFKRRGKKVPLQVLKYILIWNGNLALPTLGVFYCYTLYRDELYSRKNCNCGVDSCEL